MTTPAAWEPTPEDRAELARRGVTAEALASQLQQLRHPAPPIALDRPCTIGDGIERIDPTNHAALIERGDAAAARGRVMKFVPASGAATRMFKDLISALHGARRPSDTPAARELFARLDLFPFAEELRRRAGVRDVPATDEEERLVLRTLLIDMQLADQPKALVPFHRTDAIRTAFEEHLLEGTRYVRALDGTCRMHFTVSADARPQFDAALAALTPLVQARRRGAVLSVSMSEQHPSTDTIAIDDAGAPFRTADGSLLFRPAGHGALLHNLEQAGGDLVVIKNIDNVLPDESSAEVVRWKRLLLGYLAAIQDDVFEHLSAVRLPRATDDAIEGALRFAQERFKRAGAAAAMSREERRLFAVQALARPLRICGVVRNEGEPGGAPFWTRDRHGAVSIQIVEPSQVDSADAAQLRLFRGATHFNPVDIVCALRAEDGSPYALAPFVDEDTAFLVRKSADGRELTALERPGLWNGAMAGWNTICVDVPASTFAPVKTVFDLLRPQHQYRSRAAAAALSAPLSRRVLVVDDQPVNQRLLAQILQRAGLEVVIASDGERGLDVVRDGACDLVLLDIMLPGLDGYEVLARIREMPEGQDMPVILISSLDEVSDKVRGMELGAADYVTKPFHPQEVLARVRAQLRIRSLTASLTRANQQLAQRELLLVEELRAAAEVQKALLPDSEFSTAALDSAWVFQPSLEIGGDVFNVFPFDDGSVAVFVADVSGHGVASALLTMSVAQWLSSPVGLNRRDAAPSPAEILESLEREYPFERFGKYFSIVVAVIDPAAGAIRYSSAGHPAPIIARASGEVVHLDAGGPIVGMGFGLPFEEGVAVLERGDRVVFYTDGLVEDLSSEGERFGIPRLASTFAGAAGIPLRDICAGLAETLRVRRGDAPAGDDIALLAFERR